MQKKVQEYLQISSNEKLNKTTDCQFFSPKIGKNILLSYVPWYFLMIFGLNLKNIRHIYIFHLKGFNDILVEFFSPFHQKSNACLAKMLDAPQ